LINDKQFIITNHNKRIRTREGLKVFFITYSTFEFVYCLKDKIKVQREKTLKKKYWRKITMRMEVNNVDIVSIIKIHEKKIKM